MGPEFENLVCASAPFNAKEVMPSHSALAALIAGFALTAFVLLLDRGHDGIPSTAGSADNEADARREIQRTASLLLILAAIVGLVSAYLFSSFAGDHCVNTQVQFQYPSVPLVISATLTLSGLGVAAGSLQAFRLIATIIRITVVIAASLMLFRIAVDFLYAARVVDRLDHLVADNVAAGTPTGSAGLPQALDDAGSELGAPAGNPRAGYLAREIFVVGSDDFVRPYFVTILVCYALLTAVLFWWLRPSKLAKNSSDGSGIGRAEAWQAMLTGITVVTATITVLGASFEGLGDRVVSPAPVGWIIIFSFAATAMALAVHPPLPAHKGSSS